MQKDGVVLLWYLFKGGAPLSSPGTQVAWFDPTPDDLSCEVIPAP
jgi:hypothetical protein